MELGKTPVEKHEHVLVGLSSSPSNRKIIEEASKLAKAFDAEFTALYVSKSQEITLPPEGCSKTSKQYKICRRSGCKAITNVIGDNVSLQIAEFARISGVTKIVIGRSDTTRKPFGKSSL